MTAYTAESLLLVGASLNRVMELRRWGHITDEIADAYFREWCKGKLEHRWNEIGNYPEVCHTNPRTGAETWSRFRWS